MGMATRTKLAMPLKALKVTILRAGHPPQKNRENDIEGPKLKATGIPQAKKMRIPRQINVNIQYHSITPLPLLYSTLEDVS
jgi:hypothetical protein